MSGSTSRQPIVTTIVALALAALYVAACWFLLRRFALDQRLPELQWQRALMIFSGISSVGFAAIGVLLGTTVQQMNVSAAKADANKKAIAIKGAIAELAGTPGAKPDDIGGGTADTRAAAARRILLESLT